MRSLEAIKESLAYGGQDFGGYREELEWLVSEVERLITERNHWRHTAHIGATEYAALLEDKNHG